MGGKKIENLFDITVPRVNENSHILVIEFNVLSPLPGHKYLVGGKKIENLFDITDHRVKENSHMVNTKYVDGARRCCTRISKGGFWNFKKWIKRRVVLPILCRMTF